jgi:hypothetical protein
MISLSRFKLIKAIFGRCQCEGCMNTYSTRVTVARAKGTTVEYFHVYVCDECLWEIQLQGKF